MSGSDVVEPVWRLDDSKKVSKDLARRAFPVAVDTMDPSIPDPLPKSRSFTMLINGPPGCGKTDLLLNLVVSQRKKLYNQKFDAVFVISPSQWSTRKDWFGRLPNDQRFAELSAETLQAIRQKIYGKGLNVLIIMDDVAGDMETCVDDLWRFISNRRHISNGDEQGKGGSVSLIMLTQVYNRIPLRLRKLMEYVVMFKPTSMAEWDSLYDGVGRLFTRDAWRQLYSVAYQQKYNHLIFDVNQSKLYLNFRPLLFQPPSTVSGVVAPPPKRRRRRGTSPSSVSSCASLCDELLSVCDELVSHKSSSSNNSRSTRKRKHNPQ